MKQIVGAIFIGLVASAIFYFVQRGFLDSHFFPDDAKNAAEQARIDVYKAEALRRQEAAARAQAEAVAERISRQVIEEQNSIRQKRIDEENRRAKIEAEIEAQQARRRAEQKAVEETQENRRRLQAQAESAAMERAQRLKAYRAANGGCDIGSRRVCIQVGPTGGGGGGYNAGCFCQAN